MKNLENLLLGIIGGLIVSEIIRRYEPVIGYAIYAGIVLLLFINILIYFKNRIRIKIIKQNFADRPFSVIFEAINLSDKPNSISENIVFKCLLPDVVKSKFPNGTKYKCVFKIKSTDRLLEPHKPKIFTASTTAHQQRLMFSWFRKYIFSPSKGMYSIIFVRNALDNGVSRWCYRYEMFLYRFFKIIKETDSVEVD